MSLTVGKADYKKPVESVSRVEQRRNEGTDTSTVQKNIADKKLTEFFTNFKYSSDVPKVTSNNNQVREQATVASATINKPLFEYSNNETKTNLIASTEKPKKNVTSSGIGTVAKRFGTGKDKKEDPVNSFMTKLDSEKQKELASLDNVQSILGGVC